MPRYQYKAKKTSGEIIEGVLEADNRKLVVNRLQSMRCFPLSIKEEGGKGFQTEVSLKMFERIGLREISTFCRQMSDLLRSGLPLSRCLDVIVQQTTNRKFREVLRTLKSDVSGGTTFAESLKKHPKVFSDLMNSMIHAGEVSGSLDAVMERLADFTESELETRNKVISAMAYPLIMLLVGAGVVAVLVVFVIPRFSIMFETMDQELPPITQVMLSLSSIVSNYWYLILAVLAVGFWGIGRYRKTEEGKIHVDSAMLKIPLVKDYILKREVARFARTMGTLLGNGVPILTALEIVEAVLSNELLRKQIVNVRDNIREGERVSTLLGRGGVFPPMVVNMVAVGEETGSLETTLERIANAYEADTDRAMQTLTTMMEPMLIIVMAVVVLVIVMAMILPIFQLSTSLN